MEQERVWREQIRETLFVPEDLPKLDVQVHGQFSPESGVVAERVSYGTQFGMRIPAIVYRPESALERQCPAFIVVNGHGGDKYSWYPFYTGVLYARAGMVVLTYDPTGEGERNRDRKSGTRAHDKVEGPDELARRLSGLMMTDVMQAVSYLSQRPEVDPARIAAAGYSMGSFVLGICGAIETRLHACVLVGGGNLDGEDECWDNSKPMCQGIPYRSLGFLCDRGAVLYAMHASRGPTLVFNGLQDTVVNMPDTGEPFFADLRVRTVALKGDEVDIFETGFVPDVSHRPFFVTRPVALWLERHMGFPFWSEADIRAMGETHIGTWAAAGGVEMDPGYATEEREAGTLALGEGVPGFKWSDLNVYSDAEWEGLKDRLTHESWRRQARAVQIST